MNSNPIFYVHGTFIHSIWLLKLFLTKTFCYTFILPLTEPKVYNQLSSWWEKRISLTTGVRPTRCTPQTGPQKRRQRSWKNGRKSSAWKCPTLLSRRTLPRLLISMLSHHLIWTQSWKSFLKSVFQGLLLDTFSWYVHAR